MIEKLKQFFNTAIDNQPDFDNQDQVKTLAAAALMLDIIAVDDDQHETEKKMLRQILSTQFQVDHDKADALIARAEQARLQATDYYGFTSEINRYFSAEEKIGLIESLWQIAWADNEIHQLEQHVIRRLANLLHVSHKDFIAAKLAVTSDLSS